VRSNLRGERARKDALGANVTNRTNWVYWISVRSSV